MRTKKPKIKQLQKWHDTDEYQMIIDAIEAVPESERDFELVKLLARAYANSLRYGEAYELLSAFSKEGERDAVWNWRMGLCLYETGREAESIPFLSRAIELGDDDPETESYLRMAQKSLTDEAGTEACGDEGHAGAGTLELYTDEELDAVEEHIAACFGAYYEVFHEIFSPDIHVDICIVKPTPERNYYTLVTMGMGAHRMNVPEELKHMKLDRAEVLVTLPPDWKISDDKEKWYWPLRWLKVLARLPGENDTWLGYGHTVTNEGPFAKNTKLCCIMVTMPYFFGTEAHVCKLPGGDEVVFYQMLPIYENEMDFKLSNDAEALENLFPDDFDMVVDIARENFIPRKKRGLLGKE